MEISLIVIIAAIIIGIALSIKILKSALKIAFAIAGLLFFIVLIVLGAAYFDAKTINNILEEGDKVVLYQEGDSVLAGIKVDKGNFLIEGTGTLPENIDVFNASMLITYEEFLFEDSIEDNEIVFVVTNDSFSNVSFISLNEIEFSKVVFDKIMNSDNPKEVVVSEALLQVADITEEEEDFIVQSIESDLNIFSDDEFKSALFLVALSQLIEDNGETYLLELIKDEKIIIYPDFFLLKIIKFVPDKLFDKTLDKVISIGEKDIDEVKV